MAVLEIIFTFFGILANFGLVQKLFRKIWGTVSVIRMNVSDLHVGESCLVVVGLTILSLVLWLNTKYTANG